MGRNVLITGGNSGIGLEMAQSLAAMGDRVIIAARDPRKSEAALAAIRAATPAAEVEALPLDLGDFASVDRLAQAVLARMPAIDLLVLNAGLFGKRRRLANGLEEMIGIMHFGHFRLTQQLLDAVKAARQGRIVITSSEMHRLGHIDEAAFTDPSRLRLAVAGYCQAKLANLLFTRELSRRLRGTRVTANAFHPGAVATGIYRDLPGPVGWLIQKTMLTPAQGADTGLYLANAPELREVSGEYFVKRRSRPGSRASRDLVLAGRLWQLSESMLTTPAARVH